MSVPYAPPASVSTLCLDSDLSKLTTFYESLRAFNPDIPMVVLGHSSMQAIILLEPWTNVSFVVDENLVAYTLDEQCIVLENAILMYGDSTYYDVSTVFDASFLAINKNNELCVSLDRTYFWSRSHSVLDRINRLYSLNVGLQVLDTVMEMFQSDVLLD